MVSVIQFRVKRIKQSIVAPTEDSNNDDGNAELIISQRK